MTTDSPFARGGARRAAAPGFLALLLALAACEGALTAPPTDAGGGGSDAGDPCQGVAPRTLDQVYPLLLGEASPAGCALSGCHGTNAGALRFTSAAELAAATVGVRSASEPTRLLVAPGAPTQSVLYRRLLADAASRMPVGGPYLTDAELADVAGWICAGALPPAPVDGGTETDGGATTDAGAADAGVDAGTGPRLVQVSPAQLLVGESGVLTLTGANFTASSVAKLDAELLATTAGTATQLTAAVAPTSTATARVASLVVVDGSATSNALTFTVANPAPTLTALTPSQVPTGGAPLTLTLTGTGFTPASTATFDGAAATATFVNATTLTLPVPTLNAPRGYPVTVTNAAPGGGTSATLSLTALAVTGPSITGLAPNPTLENQAFTLTVTGAGFACSGQASVVLLDGTTTLTPATCSTTQLTVSVGALAAGSYAVTVRNGTGTPSAPATLNVVAPNPVPTLMSLSPATAGSGQAGFTLTLDGANFASGATARWNGASRATTVLGATRATASISSADVAAAGAAQVTLVNPAPGGGESNALGFTIEQSNPVPVVSALSPCGTVAGAGSFSMTITGTGFVPGATATLGGAALTVTAQTATSLTVTVPAAAIATAPAANTLPLVVTNPAPGGGAGAPFTFGLASAPATLATHVQPLLTANCATAGCHTATAMQVPMSLTAGSTYANVVGVPCTQCPPRLRVKACDPTPQGSYLIAKVKNVDVCFGTRMPKAAPLSAAELQTLVNWVAQGAPQ